MRTRNRFDRPRRPSRRQAEMPRLHRGRRGTRDRDSARDRYSADDELPDLDLDSILEVDDDELELIEEDMDLGLEDPGVEPGECPPGCVPVEDEPAEDKDDEPAEDKDDEPAEDKDDEPAEDKDDKDDKKEASVTLSAKWAPLYTEADVKRLNKTAEVVMVPFFNQDDPSYVVLANARPVGEIRLSDLDQNRPDDQTPEQLHSIFTAEAFPKGIVQAIEKLGADQILGDLDLRYYAAQVTRDQADNAAKLQVEADLEETFQTRAASMKQQFINNMLLAVEASTKNIFMRNPLRDALRTQMRSAGIPDAVAVDLWENAVQTAGAEYLGSLVKKADEWLGFDESALRQVEASIRETDYVHPTERGMQVEADVNRERQQSVPVRTMQPAPSRREAEVDEWDDVENSVKNVLRQASTVNKGRR